MKNHLMIMFTMISFSFVTNAQEIDISNYEARFGRFNGHYFASFEPCVHRSTQGGWYDHCFFSLNGVNEFGEPVSDEAKECALKTNKVLIDWLAEKDSPVEQAFSILEKHKGKKQIYMIVTDTVGSTYHNADRASLWTWPENNGDGKFFKYNIAIDRNGGCHMPTEAQVVGTIRYWVGATLFDSEFDQMTVGQSSPATAVNDENRGDGDADHDAANTQATGQTDAGATQSQ